MANTKISELTAVTALAGTDVFPVVDVSASTTNKVSVTDLLRNAPAGTAGAPGIANADDQDTGILFPAANSIGVSTGGAQRLVIDSSGRVGIGTASPATTLELKSDANAQTTATIPTLRITNDDGSAVANDITGSVEFFSEDTSDPNHVSGFMRAISETSAGVNYALTFGTKDNSIGDAAERLRIDSSGNIGIGTSSPSSNIHVVNSSASAGLTLQSTAYSANYTFYAGATGTNKLGLYDNAASAYRFLVDSSGNFGIGTTSPDALLDVENSSGASEIQIKSLNASDCTLAFGDNADTDVGRIRYAHSADAMLFFTAATERMRINSSGSVQIGASANVGDRLLQIQGNSSSTADILIAHSVASANQSSSISFAPANNVTGGKIACHAEEDFSVSANRTARLEFYTRKDGTLSERMRIDSSGRLLAGVTTSSDNVRAVFTANSGSSGDGGVVHLRRGADAAIAGTHIGTLGFVDGNGLYASIIAQADAAASSGDSPGRLIFSTTADGASSATERLRIDSSGNVGIGTAVPKDALHVSGNIRAAANAGGRLILEDANQGDSSTPFYLFASDSGNLTFTSANRNASGGTTGSTERMRIDSSGRLLVGTTAEGQGDADNLTIEDSGNCGITIRSGTSNAGAVYFSDATSGGGEYDGYINYNQSSRFMSFATATAERMRIDSSGRVGIGTSSPEEPLHIKSNSGAIRLENTVVSNNDATISYDDTTLEIHVDNNNVRGSSTISFRSDGTERMRIGDDGATTVLTSSYGVSAETTQGAGTSYFNFRGRYGSSGTPGSGVQSFLVWSNGNVQNTNNSYGAISDAKLKENIVDASSQWDDIKDIRVRNYNFIEGQTHTQLGVVAQEVETVSPGLVTESPDLDDDGNDLGTTTKSVNYSVLYMKAVKALQEAMDRIETLEAKVAALEAQ